MTQSATVCMTSDDALVSLGKIPKDSAIIRFEADTDSNAILEETSGRNRQFVRVALDPNALAGLVHADVQLSPEPSELHAP